MMLFRAENLYHPFRNSSLGFFLKDTATSPETTFGQIIWDIDLYHQPIQIPLLSLIFFIIKLFLLSVGEYLLFRVYITIKKEAGLVKNVTTVFICAQLIFWPLWVFFATSTDFIHPLNQVVGEWYCSSGSFLFYFLGTIITSHSFITAVMRYVFVVQREKVEQCGKENLKKGFLFLSVFIPLLVATWEGIESAELDSMSFINKCRGKHHMVFLVETSTLNVAKRHFCSFEKYDTAGILGELSAILSQMSCITNKIVQITIGLNIAEGFLYFRTLSYISR